MILPLAHVRDEGKRSLNDYQDQIDQATLDLRGLAAAKAEAVKLQAELVVATNRFVIRPVLGSTLVTVQNIVEPMAADCGLQVESFTERGRVEMPVDKKEAGFTIERYLMEVAAAGSYAAVRDFVLAVEQTNECVCVTDVEITGRNDLPGKHRVRICMEWPVFGEHKDAETAPAPAARARNRGRTEGKP